MKAPLLTTMSNFVSEISSCKWLFLNSIGEPEENSLRLEILEAATLHDPEAEARPLKESLERGLPLGSPIRHVAGCRIFTVEWPDYVAYSIRNESYVTTDEYEVLREEISLSTRNRVTWISSSKQRLRVTAIPAQ